MSDQQNPTQNPMQKNAAIAHAALNPEDVAIVSPVCPYCGRALPGMNVLSMELPTARGGMVWLLPSCPFVVQNEDGTAVDGKEPCGKILGVQWTGEYTVPAIARPGSPGWVG